jgi:hypothetical protein
MNVIKVTNNGRFLRYEYGGQPISDQKAFELFNQGVGQEVRDVNDTDRARDEQERDRETWNNQ